MYHVHVAHKEDRRGHCINLELELQMVVNYHVELNPDPLPKKLLLLTTDPSLQALSLGISYHLFRSLVHFESYILIKLDIPILVSSRNP